MDTPLWEQIAAFDFDQPVSEYGFSTRLAFENNWTLFFTADAIVEYKKFMYLAATSDKMVSPSPIVDIVWHQHLIFTQSYYEFCQILGKKIEHIPSTHDPKQANAFKEAELRTTKSYETSFGMQPAEFWKFHKMTDSLDLEMAKWPIQTIAGLGIAIFLVLLLPISYLLKPIFEDIDGKTFLWLYSFLIITVFVSLRHYNNLRSRAIGRQLSFRALIRKLTPQELIFMESNRLPKIIHSHVNNLIKNGTIKVSNDKKLRVVKGRVLDDNFDKAIFDTIDEINTIFYGPLIRRLLAKPMFRQIAKSAAEINAHFQKTKLFANFFVVNYIILLSVLLIGCARLTVGIMRERPVVYLVMLLVVAVVLAIHHINVESDFLIRRCIPDLFRDTIKSPVDTDTPDWSYFLLGNAIIAASFLPLMSDAKNSSNDSWGLWGGSSCGGAGSSCSSGGSSCSSGCGGGCGGCGGS
jgi:uncharacterized protein (TIGR04222 family)